MNAAADDAPLRAAYGEYDRDLRNRTLRIAMLISVGGILSGIGLDYFVYPERVRLFAGIRVALALVLLGVLAVLHQGALVRSRRRLQVIGVFAALAINFSFCMMIYLTNGPLSPYYAALNLIIMAMSTLLPWNMAETGALCLGSLLLYGGACVANMHIGQPGVFPILAFNLSFILITSMVCLTMTYFLSRGRFEDFRLRHQLDRQNRELQDLDRIKTQFFSNISHELRTPLTLILAPTETLLSKAESLEAKVHQGLMLIHRNTLRLLKLINDLLDLTRLDQGVDLLRPQTIRVDPFVRGIVDSVRHLGLAKKLRFRFEESDTTLEVPADPARLEKVLVNLLTNAIKYTPMEGTIRLAWGANDGEVWIAVRDTGVGIPEDDLPRIFDRFHQVRSNAANQTQGVGIGLALARELVEKHGGRLDVESRLGEGSTFCIRLPRRGAGAPAAAAPAGLPAASEEPFEKAFRSADRSWRAASEEGALPIVGFGDRTILVADDETDMRQYIVGLLAEEYRVVQTQHGGNVTELVERHRPDLVLLDWMMPQKDGLAVCRELRSDPRHEDVRIVLLTARIDEESKIEALRSGADDFLTKPFSSVEVKTRVGNLLRTVDLQKDLRARNLELAGTIERLERTETLLIQSEKMNAIGSLSAGLLHEINNPLNYTLTAVGFARQLRDQLTPEMQEVLADIEEGMIRIRDVVTDLKGFAYPEKPGAESEFTLAEVFRSARKIVAGEIGTATLEVDLPENLVVRGQKTQLMHVFINLLNNAALAVREGPVGGPPTISVRGSVSDEMVTVEVADNGPGIRPEIITRVFDPFFTTREVGAGMGMGLSICHTIMESHQGSIRAGNRETGGAIFTVTLPLAQEAPKPC